MRTEEEIDKEIAEAEKELKDVHGTETEVYARIVGYYRAVKNWNKGKRDEFDQRKMFDEPGRNDSENCTCENCSCTAPENLEISENDVTAIEIYTKPGCPNCPPVKSWVEENIKCTTNHYYCEPNSEGLEMAVKNGIMTCPTVRFLNFKGKEVARAHNTQDLEDIKSNLVLVSVV